MGYGTGVGVLVDTDGDGVVDGKAVTLKQGAGSTFTLTGSTLTIAATGSSGGDITSVSLATDSGTATVLTGAADFTVSGGEGIDTSASGTTVTITAETATSSNLGVASFATADFTVTAGAVTIKAAGVDLTAQVTGTLPIANGGTGATSLNDLITLGTHTTGDYTQSITGGTGITVTGGTGEGSTPSIAVDGTIATTTYVDSVAQGLDVKTEVVVATTANITLSGEQTIDGILTSTSRVLVKDQTSATENGVYVSAAGAWARATDMDASSEFASTFIFVTSGTTNADTGWVCTVDTDFVLDTDNATFTQFSNAGHITPGDGLDKTGNTMSLDLKANGGLVIESTEVAVDLGASSITGTLAIGDGGTGATTLNDLITLGTHSTGNYVATVADAGNSRVTVSGSGSETAAVTLDIADNAIGMDQLADITRGSIIYGATASNTPTLLAVGAANTVLMADGTDVSWSAITLGTHTTGNYVATVADAGNSRITVTGSGSETAAVTLDIADNAVGVAQLAHGTQGDILYYGASGAPALLAAGTSGHFLKTQGAGADPVWAAASGGGGNAFTIIAVSGQNNVEADSATDTLTFVAGAGMTITTDDAAGSVTFASSGSSKWGYDATATTKLQPSDTITTTITEVALIQTEDAASSGEATDDGTGEGIDTASGVAFRPNITVVTRDAATGDKRYVVDAEDHHILVMNMNATTGAINAAAAVVTVNLPNASNFVGRELKISWYGASDPASLGANDVVFVKPDGDDAILYGNIMWDTGLAAGDTTGVATSLGGNGLIIGPRAASDANWYHMGIYNISSITIQCVDKATMNAAGTYDINTWVSDGVAAFVPDLVAGSHAWIITSLCSYGVLTTSNTMGTNYKMGMMASVPDPAP